jgi:gliding motility-associated-like protein
MRIGSNFLEKYMKSIAAGAFVLSALCFGNTVCAQCDFDLDIVTVQNSTCVSNGVVKVTLSGEDINTDIVRIILSRNGTIIESTENGHLFGALAAGTYTVTAQAVCKGSLVEASKIESVTVEAMYNSLNGIVNPGKLSSLNCLNTGMVSITVWNGAPPYKVSITSKPDSYTGETEFDFEGGTITFEELAPGEYNFVFFDNCSSSKEFSGVIIDNLDSDFPSNLYGDFLQFASCNSAYVGEDTGSSSADPDNIYWNSMRDEYYEVAFSVDGTKNWQGFADPQYISLPESYNKLYMEGKTVKAYIRLKGTDCEQLVNEIQFSAPPVTDISHSYEYLCSNYNLRFHLYSNITVCPYTWEVREINSEDPLDYTVVEKSDGTVMAESGEQTVDGLLYDKNYVLIVTDADGFEIYRDNFSYASRTTGISAVSDNKLCGSYELSFKLDDEPVLCPPLEWKIFDMATDTQVDGSTEEIVGGFGVQTATNLMYNTEYYIVVTDVNGKTAKLENISRLRSEATVKLNSITSHCDSYEMPFYLENAAFMCPPFSWKIVDEANNIVDYNSNIDPFGVQTATNLQYDVAYILTVTDDAGHSTLPVQFSQPVPVTDIKTDMEELCENYKLSLSLEDENVMCEPLKWTVTDEDDNPVTVINATVEGLLYNKNYKIEVEDDKGKKIELPSTFIKTKVKNPNFTNIEEIPSNYSYDLCYSINDICFPYELEIFEEGNPVPVTVISGNNTSDNCIEDLEYGKNYIIKVTDKAGDTETVTYFVEPPERKITVMPGGGGGGGDLSEVWDCESYQAATFVENVNIPYEWRVYLEDGTLYKSGTSDDGDEGIILGLEYDTKYIIEITDGITILRDIIHSGDIQFPLLFFSDTVAYDYQCEDYTFKFTVNNAYCLPYKWKIRNREDGTYIAEGESENTVEIGGSGTHDNIKLLYNTVYEIIVTDSKNHEIKIEEWYKNFIKPELTNGKNSDPQCENYRFDFTVENIYCDYTLEVFNTDMGNVSVYTEDIILVPGTNTYNHSLRLGYDSAYVIKITEKRNGAESFIWPLDPKPSFQPVLDTVTEKHSCDYEARFSMKDIYCHYSWEAVNDVTGIIVDNGDENSVRPLLLHYDTSYTLTVTYTKNNEENLITRQFMKESKVPYLTGPVSRDFKCDDYEFNFQIDNLDCFPYEWEVRNSEDEPVAEGQGYDFNTQTVRLQYDVEYTVKATDRFGHVIPEIKFEQSREDSPAPEFTGSDEDYPCHEYIHKINVTLISCFPYKWEVRDSEGEIVGSEEDIENYREHPVTLKYTEDYTVTVTDAIGKSTSVQISKHANPLYKPKVFNINSYLSSCISDLKKGYIEIYGMADMLSGVRIRFIDGPQTPENSDVTLEEFVPYFYPFSENYKDKDNVVIAEGVYSFEITDICGDKDTLEIIHKNSAGGIGLDYELDEKTDLCLGMTRIYLKGKIRTEYGDGTVDETADVWFVMTESPVNTNPNVPVNNYIRGNKEDEYFSIANTGRYVFEIKKYWNDECSYDTIVYNHVQKSNTIDGFSAYICDGDTESKGNIHVQAINGQPPYTYTLFEEDGTPVAIPSNNDGIFEYGALGEKYVVKVEDACLASFLIEVEISTLNHMTLLKATTNVCKGDEIQINCLLLGAKDYKWTGPQGNIDPFPDLRSISIPDAEAENSGTYTVEIIPAGCNNAIKKEIDITVHDIPVPVAPDVIELCIAETEYVLSAEALGNDYSLQWYSEDEELLASAPAISLSEIKDTVFYVTQTLNTFNCVSDKKKIEVRINPLPEKNANATGWSCENGQPEITVTNVVAGYVYSVYADADATDLITTFTGTDETMVLTLPVTVADNTSLYLKTATSTGCILPSAITEIPINVTKIAVLTETLPVYRHEMPYSVQIESDAVQPVFSAIGNLPAGLVLSPNGLISGTVPRSTGYEEMEFTVTVTDENGCQASRDYLLRSCGPAPETPLSEVSYCKNTQSVPLEALSPEGLPLRWYDAGLTELPEAPAPPTGTVGEQVFYAVQVNDALLCVSDTAEIKVKITPLPEPDFEAPDVNVCYGDYPVIALAKLHGTYVYDIYYDALMTEKLASVTGELSADVTLPETVEESASYFVLVTDSLSCVSQELKEAKANVILLDIYPAEIPAYRHETPYSVQIESNAVQPVFSVAGNLPAGLVLSPDGLISGTVPRSTGYEEMEFTVTVTDENGCLASRDYLLRNCGPAPETLAEVSYCIGAQSLPLSASSPEGWPLKWYSAELTELPEAPTPLTDKVGEQIFYVSLINEALQCESETAKISVFTTPLPLIDFKASANDVCFGNSPSILLEEIDEMAIYSVYSDKTFSNELDYLTGKNSGIVSLDDILENSATYCILKTDSMGCVSSDWLEVTAEVVKLYIEPDKLPPYIKNTDYEQLLLSNAVSPIFAVADGYLPEGLTLNSSGLIYGKVPNSYRDVSNTVTVEVQDINGCKVTHEYTFDGNLFVPKAFTPNGDGVNDVFMPGYRLIIFDRLGIELYQGDNGWDGTYKGKPVAEDIYFYKLEYPDSGGTKKITTGYIGVHH